MMDSFTDGATVEVYAVNEAPEDTETGYGIKAKRMILMQRWVGLSDIPTGSQACRICAGHPVTDVVTICKCPMLMDRHLQSIVHSRTWIELYMKFCFMQSESIHVCRLCPRRYKRTDSFKKHLQRYHPRLITSLTLKYPL
jgi:hypothetical protein